MKYLKYWKYDTEEEMISLETAILAKEKGFVYNTSPNYYSTRVHDMAMAVNLEDDKHFPAPPQSMLQKWLREVHNIYIEIHLTDDITAEFGYRIIEINKCTTYCDTSYTTYELCLEKALFTALTFIK